ncbi:MAG TPA: hypothetical protein PLE45_10785 [Spirochaetota bacterium]|nr:hypothetical protein [Spirochaetota bacterium]HOL57636.1 hypothetical protein [Spirochaetota bacterium]HPP05185.1 hypothetical protein [Spirochaetota bacterium]
MKLKFIIFLLFFFVFNLFSQNKIKILILDFKNINNNEEYNYITDAISDALKASLYKIEKFEPYLIENVNKDLKNATYEEIVRYALNEKFNVLIKGYYYISEEKIRISFSVVDTISGRLKIGYDKDGETGIEIFNLIKEASKILSEKMDREITPYPEEFAEKKRKEKLASKESELFIFLNGGVIYDLFVFDNPRVFKDEKNFHSISTIINTNFYFELPTKRDYLGFEFSIFVPIVAPTKLIANFKTDINLVYGFKKRHFWGIGYSLFFYFCDIFEEDFYKENNNIFSLNNIKVFYPVCFNIKYAIHFNDNHILEIDSTIYPYFWKDIIKVEKINSSDFPKEGINNVLIYYWYFNSSTNYNSQIAVINNSLVIPIDIGISYYFYPVKNIGFKLTTRISFMSLNFIIPSNSENIPSMDFGSIFSPVFSIYLGITFKDRYIIKRERYD